MVATGADETDGRVDGDADDADDATGANDAADVSDAPAPELWGQTTLWDFGVFDPE